MIRKFLIILLHLQIVCHGIWAMKPPPSAQQDDILEPVTSTLHHPPPALLPGNKIVSVATNCTRDVFYVAIELGKPFRGILFAKDFLEECRIRGNKSSKIVLKIPNSGCGVRSEPKPDGGLNLSVKVMLQMDEKLRQSSDIERVIRCSLPASMMTMDVVDGGLVRKPNRNGRMRLDPSTPAAPRVRIWLELGGNDGTGEQVEVGQATTLSVRAVVPGNIGLRVVDCAALDGLGEASQKLLDERGCPIDEQVMPALHTQSRPHEEGWTKISEDDLVDQLYTATFPAFKFPDRERLHVSCGVQLCKGKCPKVNCRTGEPFLLNSEKQLARIEVFNSLAVTAPQIEIDRLRYDRRYNMSAEEYPPRVRSLNSEGTGVLCLSISKLALAFCLLGLIFLVAVIVAVCCLLRSKKESSDGSLRAASTSMFSSSSESQSRFGSKLLIPYGGTLPYGRVY